MKVKIIKGWFNEGDTGTVMGENILCNQLWTPVLWDGEESPEFFKTAALHFYEEERIFESSHQHCVRISKVFKELSVTVGGVNSTRRHIILNMLSHSLAMHYGTKPGTDEFDELAGSFRDSLLELCKDEEEGS